MESQFQICLASFFERLPQSPLEPWVDILRQATDLRHGEGKELQNPEKAQRLFRQAAQLGSGKAWQQLGSMVLYGEGCLADEQKALELFQRAAQAGEHSVYPEMADIFLKRGHHDNFQKCWGFLFESDLFLRFTNKALYVANYLGKIQCSQLPNKHAALLYSLKEEILRNATDQAEDNEFQLFAADLRDYFRGNIELIKESLFR